MAIACLRLFTFLPLRPLLRVPRLRRLMALLTVFEAPLEYFRAIGRSLACDLCLSRQRPWCLPVPCLSLRRQSDEPADHHSADAGRPAQPAADREFVHDLALRGH